MKKSVVIVILLGLSLSASSLSFTEDNDPGKNDTRGIGQRPDQRQSDREIRRLQQQQSDPRGDDGRGYYPGQGRANDHRGNYQDRSAGRYDDQGRAYRQYPGNERHERDGRDGRGAGPYHDFHRGDRLPAEYRNRQYVVDDWRGHGLSAPPRGYQWVQTGGDYVLVSVATGLITQLLLGH